MLLIKLLFLTSCYLMVYGSESSEELQSVLEQIAPGLLKEAVKEAYEEDKLGAINNLVSDDQFPNYTLIATQQIYGRDGKVSEIRTVELHIPSVEANEDASYDDDDDDADSEADLQELRKLFDLTSSLGLDLQVYVAEFSKDQELTSGGYLSKDTLFGVFSGFSILNRTIEVDKITEVNEKIKELQAGSAPVAVHKFDGQGQFIAKGSVVVPEYAVSVVNEEGSVSLDDLENGKKALATIFLQYQNDQDEIPSKLAEHLSQKYPDYDVFVFLQEPDAWYANYNYKVELRFELTSWDSPTELIYSVFLNKKNQQAA